MQHYQDTKLRNPFSTLSNKIFPKTVKDCFDWAQWLHNRFPTIGNVINKVVRYFAADINVTVDSNPQQTDTQRIHNYQELLKQTYNCLQLAIRVGQQLATMGNVFVSAQRIFTRYLACPKCQLIRSIKTMKKGYDYQWQNGSFTGTCACGNHVIYKIIDSPSTAPDGSKVRFVFRSPRDMLLKYNQLTGDYKFLYKLPDHIKQGIIQGSQVYLQNTPKLYLDAATTNDYISFPQDRFYFSRIQSLSSMDRLYKGWGTPLFLSSFNNVLRLAYLDKFNQAVATDYIAPLRMISPPPQNLAAGNDPNKMPISGWAVRQFIQQAITKVKDNPSTWVVSPFPLQYQMLGGQAKAMTPVQLIQWYQNRILQDISVPVQLRQTSFQQVAPSMGLRMFQRQWIHFASQLQSFISWSSDIISQAHSTEQYKVTLDKTSFVQDDMNKQLYMQLASGGVISQDTFLKSVGLDFKEQMHKKSQENQYQMQLSIQQQSVQQGMEMAQSVIPPAGSVGVGAAQFNMQMVQQQNMQAAQGGAPMPPGPPAAPGAPMPPAGGATQGMPFNTENSQSASLDALYQQAQAKAQQISQIGLQQGQGARMSALRKLKAIDPVLHAQVKAILETQQQQVASQAVAQFKNG